MKSLRKKSIVLLSGGMDSLLCMALSHQRQDEIFTLHFSYGQRTWEKEKHCTSEITNFYHVPASHQFNIDLNFLKNIGGSALTDTSLSLSETGENLEKNIIPSSYVPYRNTLMLSYALSLAEVYNVSSIIIGAVQDDELGYPDCRKIFFDAFQKMATLGGNTTQVIIETPLIDLKKVQIVSQLIKLKAPIEYSWSCYQASDLACGVCDSCRLRLQAFESIGSIDLLKYQKTRD